MPEASETWESLLERARFARRDGRGEDARQHVLQAMALCREAQDRAALSAGLAALGQIERDCGDLNSALKHYREAVELLRNADLPLRLAHTVRHSGDILQDMGPPLYGEADACYREALTIYRSHDGVSLLDLANAIRGFALLCGKMGHSEQSRQLWLEAQRLYAEVGITAGVEESERRLAKLPS